jgi:hypothetical protein
MVIVTYKVQQAMDDDTVKFLVETRFEIDGIVTDAVHTYEKVTGKDITFAIIESDDVSIIVMMEIFPVHTEKILVRTENDIDVA